MRSPSGYLVITDPGAANAAPKVEEHDTFQCCHCGNHVLVPAAPVPMPGGFCRCCMQPVCETCHGVGTCTPFMKRIEREESRARLLAAVG